jgi:hypothetical protein
MGRREITTTITMLVLCGVLVLGAVWGWRSLFADLPAEEASAPRPSGPSCTTEEVDAGQRLRSSQVRVSVFNGGNRSGLADETMSRLANRGFKRGAVGNAPSDVNVRRVEVWSTQENDAEARLVARQFGKRLKVTVSDQDLGPGVDVIVGNAFRGFVKGPRSVKVRAPEEVCVPAETISPDTNAGAAAS